MASLLSTEEAVDAYALYFKQLKRLDHNMIANDKWVREASQVVLFFNERREYVKRQMAGCPQLRGYRTDIERVRNLIPSFETICNMFREPGHRTQKAQSFLFIRMILDANSRFHGIDNEITTLVATFSRVLLRSIRRVQIASTRGPGLEAFRHTPAWLIWKNIGELEKEQTFAQTARSMSDTTRKLLFAIVKAANSLRAELILLASMNQVVAKYNTDPLKYAQALHRETRKPWDYTNVLASPIIDRTKFMQCAGLFRRIFSYPPDRQTLQMLDKMAVLLQELQSLSVEA